MSSVTRPFLRGSVRPARGLISANTRLCSSKKPAQPTKEEKKKAKTSIHRPAPSPTHDWIGPPNALSNLRPIVYRVPEQESQLETRLRRLRQETEDWNQDFWTTQNTTFTKNKESFIAAQLRAKGLSRRDEKGRRRTLDSEEMAEFYKKFLDENRTRHANYNREWYRRNFTITFLMARVALQNLWKHLTPNSSNNNGPTAT